MTRDASPTSDSNIVYHLSERSFRRFEGLIKRAVDAWPKETMFTIPTEGDDRLAPTTFVGRFRDAIVSVRRFEWETDINLPKLVSLAGQFAIWWEPGTRNVWFRSRRRAGRPTHLLADAREMGTPFTAPAEESRVPWEDPTPQAIAALAVLLSEGRLTGTWLVKGKVAEEVVERLRSYLNVSFVYDEKFNVTVIT